MNGNDRYGDMVNLGQIKTETTGNRDEYSLSQGKETIEKEEMPREYKVQNGLNNFLIDFYKKLKEEGIELKRIYVNPIEKVSARVNAEDMSEGWCRGHPQVAEKVYYNKLILLKEADKEAFIICEYPWLEEYVHDDTMSAEYFFHWRPAFKAIKEMFFGGVGAEVGVFEGFLTQQVIKYVNPRKYYLIDPYKEFTDCVGQLSKYTQEQWDNIYEKVCDRFSNSDKEVKIIRKTSLDAVQEFNSLELDFVYIDADHKAEAVYADICGWEIKVKHGGIIAGHDWQESGVKSGVMRYAVEKMALDNSLIEVLYAVNDWWFIKK